MAHLYFMPFASRRILILMESKSHVFNSRVAVGISPLHSITPTWFTHEEGCEVSDYTLQKRHKKLLFRRNRHAESMYVINERVADMLLDKLGNDLKQDSGRSIFEINPGPGVLTKKLLQSGFERIRVFEPHNEFIPYLKILESQYPHNLVLVPKDLTTIHTLSTRCKTSESTMLEGISRRPWHEDSPVTIVGVLPWKQYTFLRHMLWRLSNMSGLFSLGRCQFCLYIPHKEYWYMTAEPGILLSRYRATTVYYRLFFDIKLLHREPRSSFHPPGSEQIVKSSGKTFKDDGHMYLVELTPKRDLLEQLPKERLPELYFFVRQLMNARKAKLIAIMEQWVPKCGPRLIKQGYTIYTRTGDLTPRNYMEVFKQLSSWSEYPDSSFSAAIQTVKEQMDDLTS